MDRGLPWKTVDSRGTVVADLPQGGELMLSHISQVLDVP